MIYEAGQVSPARQGGFEFTVVRVFERNGEKVRAISPVAHLDGSGFETEQLAAEHMDTVVKTLNREVGK
ncbi:MAG: hypothetical protein V3T32_07950 [Thermodesulfobacteriota bacterium]